MVLPKNAERTKRGRNQSNQEGYQGTCSRERARTTGHQSVRVTGMKKELTRKEKISYLVKSLQQMQAVFYKRSDIGSARLFSDVFRQKHRYCQTSRDWYKYFGGVWTLDAEGLSARADLKLLGEALVQYASSYEFPDDQEGKKKSEYINYSLKWLKSAYRGPLLNDAKDLNYISRECMDTDLFTLNCQNGVLNLEGGKVRFTEHNPDFLLSKITNVSYDPKATCPRWMQFMDEVTEDPENHQPDQEKKRYLQKVAGLALVGDCPEHRFFIVFGSSTRNGKSTMTETLLHIMGTYGASVNPETLAIQKTDSRRASGDVARLSGIRLAICSEAPRRMPLDSALLKKLTGGERILARHLQEREFEFQPQLTLLMNTNYLPSTTDSTIFSSDRVSVCEFNRHFEPEEQDKHLKQKLIQESSGILNWMISGFQLYLREGLIEPKSIREETQQYKTESDRVGTFLTECLEKTSEPDGCITVKQSYKLYTAWCEESGYPALGKQAFTSELRTKRIYKENFYVKDPLTGKKVTVHRVIAGYTERPLTAEENPFEIQK